MKQEITYQFNGITINDQHFISLSEIIEKCNLEKIKLDNLRLLKMEWRGWRGFSEGIIERIVLPASNIETILKYIIGKTIYFGEIAGKHSDVYNTLDENDIEIIDDPKIIVDFMSKYPDGHEYNHSFLHHFSDKAYDEVYEDMGEEQIVEFNNCY